jgi:hypothetical protein
MVATIVAFAQGAALYALGAAGLPSHNASIVTITLTYLGAFGLSVPILGLLHMAFSYVLNAATKRMEYEKRQRRVSVAIDG